MTAIHAFGDQGEEGFEIEGLENRVADRVGRELVDSPLTRGCEHDDMRPARAITLSITMVQTFQELIAVDAWHHQIEQNQVIGSTVEFLESNFTVFGKVDFEVDSFENGLKEDANRHVVIDD